MKNTVQIKAELYEGQHDALIAFYNTYPRLIVSKLLLRLCEGCMPLFPPTLAQFESGHTPSDGKPRPVAIRIDKHDHPQFWKFYKELPYGAKAIFIVNLMNHYAQLAEADRGLLESIYWSGDATAQTQLGAKGAQASISPVGNISPTEQKTAPVVDNDRSGVGEDLSGDVSTSTATSMGAVTPTDPLHGLDLGGSL